MSKNSLSTNQEMFKAIFQDDGNFVVYGWKPIWASGTNGKPGFFLIMQSDGNLERTEDNRLTLNNDGCLTIYRGSQLTWKSSKSS
uniref:Bulb-type lectin domain-containing protein n=1 Tax=Electrophorus electricus TaxID=8005 RepID=A0AAY5F6K4_ELEEL